VELKVGVKYCDFCGTKVAEESPVSAPAKKQTRGTASGMIAGIAVGFLAIGILIYVGSSIKKQKTSTTPPPVSVDGKRQAAATCEAAIRLQVRAPFRVIAFRSTLVGEERGGYVVSGTVELQSAAGELQRKRYSCKVHPDPRTGMVLDEGRLE
jgi:Na+-transporting methylmalonyl-CoA/oxaloacetate decarboxylase gamma subunit